MNFGDRLDSVVVGYVLWTIRGGWLLTSLLAQMPAWRMVDPLVVLNYMDGEPDNDDEDVSLAEMLDGSNNDDANTEQKST